MEGKHLIFKASVAEIQTCLLVDNGSETKLIDQSFMRTNKISIFKLKQQIKLELENRETMEWLDKICLIDVEISNHREQLLCYMARLEAYTLVLGDSWLQQHNPTID